MTLDNIISEINWDNWKVDEDYKGKSKDEYWDLSEVLYCKLNWIKELIQQYEGEDGEEIDTINQMQALLELIDEEKLKDLCAK